MNRACPVLVVCLLAGCAAPGDDSEEPGVDPSFDDGNFDESRIPLLESLDAPEATALAATTGNDAIAIENRKSGTTDYLLADPALDREIEAHVGRPSAIPGEALFVRVSTSVSTTYRYKVFRMGYYGGAGSHLYRSGGSRSGFKQAAPSFDPVTGLVQTRWKTSFQVTTKNLTTGALWPTGVYLIKLEAAAGKQAYVIFVLRDTSRDAEVAVQLSTATWQAYNAWGGESLYESSHGMSGGKARKVSYDRPYAMDLGYGSGLFLSKEYPAVKWLEQHGYDVEYVTSTDTGKPTGRVGNHRAFMALAHDEYASLDAMDRLLDARDRGVNLVFLTGNTMYWQVRFEDASTGSNRIEVCYKDRYTEDPLYGVDDERVATAFRGPPVFRPENELLGVMSSGGAVSTRADWVVRNASHWAYAGTGLSDGDKIASMVGYEWDSYIDDAHAPDGVTLLSASPVKGEIQNASVYDLGAGFVFDASTIDFVKHLGDARVARILANVLARAGATAYAD